MPPVIETTRRFRKDFEDLPERDQDAAEDAIAQLQGVIGLPHRHSGIGIRKLASNILELRVGLRIRVLFQPTSQGILLLMVGDHDQVRNFLKG